MSDIVQETTQTAVTDRVTETAQTFTADYVRELRQEAAAVRIKLRELEMKQKQEDDARLAQQAEWQKLAEQRAQEVESLRPYQEKYTAMLEAIKTGNAKRIEQIPDSMKTLVPTIDDPAVLSQWLDANWQILTGKPLSPSLNGGAGTQAQRTQTITLTDAELEMAAKMRIKPEDYLAAKTKKR